jgi:hypothetical protein
LNKGKPVFIYRYLDGRVKVLQNRTTKGIYTGKAFKESNLFINLRNYDKAIELLEQLEKSSDPDIAMKARNNLSIVKEIAESRK